mgnify:FL=1
MKKLPFFLLLPLLVGCSFSLPSPSSSETSKGEELSSEPIGGTSEPSSSSDSWQGSASSEEESSQETSFFFAEERTLDFYSINDYHGQIEATSSFPGIKTLGTYFKSKKQDGAILINSGDMFQGSLESNYNRGNLLTDVMNEAHFDAFSLGNHEFDWGKEAIRNNKKRKGKDGYQTPFLCANLYDFDGSQEGSIQQSDLGGETSIVYADNGLKVGIIGAIGRNQITSITSQYVADLTFKDPMPIVKTLSDRLKKEEGCDLVVLSFHAPQVSAMSQGITSISPISKKRYVDLVFCAHTHKKEKGVENGVLFTQNDDKGENASHVRITVKPNGEVTSFLSTIRKADMEAEVKGNYDRGIEEIVDSYAETTDPIGKEVLGDSLGYFGSRSEAPVLMAEAILQETQEEGLSVDLALVNQARADLPSGELSYSALFEAFPFDNEVYVLEVSGTDLFAEAEYNYFARSRKEAFSKKGRYKIAVLDYLAFHQNSQRVYDYFPSASSLGKLEKEGSPYRYREILADAIRNGISLDPEGYSTSSPRYSASYLESSL